MIAKDDEQVKKQKAEGDWRTKDVTFHLTLVVPRDSLHNLLGQVGTN